MRTAARPQTTSYRPRTAQSLGDAPAEQYFSPVRSVSLPDRPETADPAPYAGRLSKRDPRIRLFKRPATAKSWAAEAKPLRFD